MDLVALAIPQNTLTTAASGASENMLFAEGVTPPLDFAALLAAGLAAPPTAVAEAAPTLQALAGEVPANDEEALQSLPVAEPNAPAPVQLPLPLQAAVPIAELATRPNAPLPLAAAEPDAQTVGESALAAAASKPAAALAAVAAHAAGIAATATANGRGNAPAEAIAQHAAILDPRASAVAGLPGEYELHAQTHSDIARPLDTPTAAEPADLSESLSAANVAHAAPADMPQPLHAASVEHRLPAQAIAVREVSAPVYGSDFADAFSQQIVWMADKDAQIAELRLNPPELGPVEVRLMLSGDEASAQFVSPHAEVRSAIESSLVRLRESLAEAGIELGEASVSAESFRDERDPSHSDARRSASGYSDHERSAEHGSRSARVAHVRAGMIDVFA